MPALVSVQSIKSALVDLRRALRFSDKLDEHAPERITFAVSGAASAAGNPSPGTACWRYISGSPGEHLVHVCATALAKAREGADWQEYLYAFAHHELLHACLTVRDLKAAGKQLDKSKVPFSEWNLFEDARIEAVGRKEFSFPMRWTDFEALNPADNPRAYFFNLIQNAGNATDDLVAPDKRAEAWVSRVRDHYFAGALSAHKFPRMLSLLKEWVEEFPPAKSGGGDLSISANLSESDAKALIDAVRAEENRAEAGGGGLGELHSVVTEPEYTNADMLADSLQQEMNPALSRQICDRISRLLKAGRVTERTTHKAKRISSRAFAAGRLDFFRRKVDQPVTGKSKLVFLIDCSGSMRSAGADKYSAISGGLHVAWGLSLLAERGLVSGHLVLHKGMGSKPHYQTFKFPVPVSVLERVEANGSCECVEPTLVKTDALLRQSDYVFCYTDGHICDAPVNKSRLAAKGIRPIGLYCGAPQNADNLHKWFSQVIVRDTVVGLLEGLASKVDFKAALRRRHS